MFWQTATGGTVSSTVTVGKQVETLLLLSVMVTVTRLAPMSVQSKLSGLTTELRMPQASLKMATSDGVMVALPVASSCTVILVQAIAGGMVSSTVTVGLQVEVLPFTSVTVTVTTLAPVSAQVKAVGEITALSMPQESPKVATSLRTIDPLPVTSRYKV